MSPESDQPQDNPKPEGLQGQTPEVVGAEGVQPINVTPEAILYAVQAQNQPATSAAELQEKREKAQSAHDALVEETIFAFRDPLRSPERAQREWSYNDSSSNKYMSESAAPDYDPRYEQYGANRWAVAARDGVTYTPGQGGALDPKNWWERRLAERAYRRVTKAIAPEARMRAAQRSSTNRNGGDDIDPETGLSRKREGNPKLRGIPRSQRRVIRNSERYYAKNRKKSRRHNKYLDKQGNRLIDRKTEALNSFAADKANDIRLYIGLILDRLNSDDSVIKKARRVIKHGLEKVKPITQEARQRSKEAVGNGVVSSTVAYHGLASVIAEARRIRAGEVMEKTEHRQSLYVDDTDNYMPLSINDLEKDGVELEETEPRTKFEEITQRHFSGALSKELAQKIRAKRRDKAIGRIKKNWERTQKHAKKADEARRMRGQRWHDQHQSRQQRRSSRTS